MGGATIKDEMKFMSKIGLRLRKKKHWPQVLI